MTNQILIIERKMFEEIEGKTGKYLCSIESFFSVILNGNEKKK